MFIELTYENNEKTFANIDKITHIDITKYRSAIDKNFITVTSIHFANKKVLYVKEDYEKVIKMIKDRTE